MVESTIYVAYLQQHAGESGGSTPTTAAEAGATGGASHSETPAAEAGEAGHATTEAAAEPQNPILPVGAELAWGLGTFLVLWALMKFVLLKPVVAGMTERDEKVRGDLAAAEGAGEAAKASLAEYHTSLSSSKAEATRIIEDARAQGEATRKQLVGAADAEVAAQKAAAAEEVAQAKQAAKAQISASVATIATEAAGVVIQKPLDVNTQRAVVEEYLSGPGAS